MNSSITTHFALAFLTCAAIQAPACAPDSMRTEPRIQASASANPRWVIDINRVLDGVFRTYRPRCMDTVQVGHTVEFRNYQPDVPANVTTLAAPRPLYSPNLTLPYNYIGADSPENTLCVQSADDGTCTERPTWSYWRYTFKEAGIYDWVDTHSTEPGRQVVDPYYGTVTFVGIDPNAPIGTICVPDGAGLGCENVCCTSDTDCRSGSRCFRSEVDAVGRCLTPAG